MVFCNLRIYIRRGAPLSSPRLSTGVFLLRPLHSLQDKKGGGVGLSLSIANRYVRLHGGEITVASQVGEGSTFTIRIPKEV
ncbi:MAG: sensor histidine kinase [Methanoculleus sp.]